MNLPHPWVGEFPDIAHAVADKLSRAGRQSAGCQVTGNTGFFCGSSEHDRLFIGNGLGGTRLPFALAEDGMMPKFMVKVHPKYGTPWVAILVAE